MKTLQLLLLSLFIAFNSLSQSIYDECGTTDKTMEKEQKLLSPLFSNLHDFIPWNTGGGNPLNNQPQKVVELNFHIIGRPNGSGNFTPDDISRFENIMAWVNQWYSSGEPSDPILEFPQLDAYDTWFRFTLDNITANCYFYTDPDLYYYYRSTSYLERYLETYYPERLSRFNIFFNPYYRSARITAVTVNDGGSGYTSAPQVSFTTPFESTTAQAYVSNGRIDSIIITSSRLIWSGGFDEEPTVVITGGGGSGAFATLHHSQVGGSYSSSGILMHRQYTGSNKGVAGLLAHELGHLLNLGHTLAHLNAVNLI